MKETEFLRDCLRVARAAYREAQEEDPGGCITPFVMAYHPQFGITPPMPCGHFMVSQKGKDILADCMIGLVHKGATEIIFVSEIWRAQEPSKCQDPEEMKKEAQAFEERAGAWLDKHGSLEGFPNVFDCLMVTHYSDSGDVLKFAKILRDEETGERELGEWEDTPVDEYTSHGRFTEIFKRARQIAGN